MTLRRSSCAVAVLALAGGLGACADRPPSGSGSPSPPQHRPAGDPPEKDPDYPDAWLPPDEGGAPDKDANPPK